MDSAIFSWMVYALWIAVVVYLTVSAFGVKRDTEQHLGQSFGLLFALIAAFVLPKVPLLSFVNFAPVSPALSIIGLLLSIAGLGVLVAARHTLGKNWSQTVAAKEEHELVTMGPYRLVRHPMYAGGILAAIGSAIAAGGPFVFMLVVLGALFLWRVGAEDRLMDQQFPHEYPGYKRQTKALIPYIW